MNYIILLGCIVSTAFGTISVPVTRIKGFQTAITDTQKMYEDYHRERLSDLFTDLPINLTNNNNLAYAGPLYFGTPLQLEGITDRSFIYDSGSGWLTVTGSDCSSCSDGYKMYDPANSTTSQEVISATTELDYGSAKLYGSTYSDRVCLTDDGSECVSDFEFFKIDRETGLQGLDGILGLSPDYDQNGPSFMGAMKSAGLIDKEVATFWINDGETASSYVTFGGVIDGSTTGKTYELSLDKANKTWWTVDLNKSVIFGLELTNTPKAIIDTGTSFLAISSTAYAHFENEMAGVPGV